MTRDHLSAISGITLDGRLFLQIRKASYDATAVVGFLRVLLRKISGPILLIWDGSPIHRAKEIKSYRFSENLPRGQALLARCLSRIMWRNIERDSFPFCTSFLRQIQQIICQDIWEKRQHTPNEKGVISPKSLPSARFLSQNDSSRNKEETLW
ncbi:MAG TPA: hypothetical protein VHZ51_10585 [Ktedonobacteraceae bacterium]|nr:hypothetical protein [Ktedonobacteraceae bacterium]